MGIAVGLVLELAGLGARLRARPARRWLWVWPAARRRRRSLPCPRLRRHWRVRGYTPAPLGWSWTVAGAVAFFTTYLSSVFLQRNPILPTVRRHAAVPRPGLPALAGRRGQAPLPDARAAGRRRAAVLPLVRLRAHGGDQHGRRHRPAGRRAAAGDPGAVRAGRRCSPRWSAGGSAASRTRARSPPCCSSWSASSSFTDPVGFPFGTQATFVVWHGMSMIYSWVLLIAADRGARRRHRPPPRAGAPGAGPGAPRVRAGGPVRCWPPAGRRPARCRWSASRCWSPPSRCCSSSAASRGRCVAAGLLTAGRPAVRDGRALPLPGVRRARRPVAQLRGLRPGRRPRAGRRPRRGRRRASRSWSTCSCARPASWRCSGSAAAGWSRRSGSCSAGALAGPVDLPDGRARRAAANQYFMRAGFAFAVLLSGWGFVLVWERARMTRASTAVLGVCRGAVRGGPGGHPVPVRRGAHGRGLDEPGAADPALGGGPRPGRGRRRGGVGGRRVRRPPAARPRRHLPAHRHPGRRRARPDHGHAQVGAVPQRRRVRGDRVAALAGRGGPLGARHTARRTTCSRPTRTVGRSAATACATPVRSGSVPTASAGCWSRAGCSRRGSPRPATRAFWDPALLALNDEAFTAPTPPVLDALRARRRAVAGGRPRASAASHRRCRSWPGCATTTAGTRSTS